jgi:hypothetical protein
MKLTVMLTIIVTLSTFLFPFQLSSKGIPGTMIAYGSIDFAGNNTTEDVPNLISTPPPPLSSTDQVGNTNGTNATQEGPSTVLQPQRSTPEANFSSEIDEGQTIGVDNQTLRSTGNSTFITSPLLKPITKEQALKAEQGANAMLEAYYRQNERSVNKTSNLSSYVGGNVNTSVAQTCLEGEFPVQIDANSVCLSSYEISTACNPGGSLAGDPICSAAVPSPQQDGSSMGEQEVIEEGGGQGQEPLLPGNQEQETIDEGGTGEQEVIEEPSG